MPSIFISHTLADKAIADEWSALVKRLFSKKVTASYSSSKELESGIAPGADWFNWIVDNVRSADVAFIILSPNSIQKPWVVWEAGAVAGAAYATSKGPDDRRVVPVTYGIGTSDVPSPFAGNQVVRGTDAAEIRKLTQDLFKRFAPKLDDEDKTTYGAERNDAERDHLKAIEGILRVLPHTVTESAVQEWMQRLEDLERERRFSETVVLDDWVNVSFGRDEKDRQRPLDVRLHRRFGQLYALAGHPAEAARQFELARRLSPRDIFLLRRLGKAHLDGGNHTAAGEVLEEIARLDASAFKRNQENAALKARWCESRGDRRGAQRVLEEAYAETPTSYYLGDLLGQLFLRDRNLVEARRVYDQVLSTLDRLAEHNVWTTATALTAALAMGDGRRFEECLSELARLRPSREQRDSITRGLKDVVEAVGADQAVLLRVQRASEGKVIVG
jgi:tetratricopeptide (TPR) repeat protein